MPIHPTSSAFWILLSGVAVGACADRPYASDESVCDAAMNVFASCGLTLEQSPFGTCAPDQGELARQVVDIHEADGCAGLTDAKADGWTCAAAPLLCTQHTVAELAPFVSDGCGMFPDGPVGDSTRWQQCCVTHDFAYYAGGPEAAREAADHELQTCLLSATSNQLLADLIYSGFRLGGTPALPTPWRWGYGWTYDPLQGYRSLPPAQAQAVAASIAAYQAHPVPPDAFEERRRALAGAISTVPGLRAIIDLINAVIRQVH